MRLVTFWTLLTCIYTICRITDSFDTEDLYGNSIIFWFTATNGRH